MKRKLFLTSCIVGVSLLAQGASSESPAPAEPASGTTDRVGFPTDYRTRFKSLGVRVRPTAPEILTVYVNDLAASVSSREQLPFPEGAIIVMEFSYALKDSNNQLKRDANGEVLMGEVEHVDVMKRGKGFGEAYGANRSGEWEYAGYRLDGTYTTTPSASAHCAACHRGAGPENDFVFRMRAPAKAAQM
ncbi:MAG: cytochrome P460 family protein [Steroidobacter sp.]